MNMTVIFVELVVIGFHTLIGISLLVFTFVNYQNFDIEKLFEVKFAFPILVVTYVLGILVDRLADITFRNLDCRLRAKYQQEYQNLPPFLAIRFYILDKSSDIYKQLEYTRSRLRIARSAILNFALMTVTTFIFVWYQLGNALSFQYRIVTCIFVVIIGAFFAFISYQSWGALIKSYTTSTFTAYRVLRGELIEKEPNHTDRLNDHAKPG